LKTCVSKVLKDRPRPPEIRKEQSGKRKSMKGFSCMSFSEKVRESLVGALNLRTGTFLEEGNVENRREDKWRWLFSYFGVITNGNGEDSK